MTSVKDVTYKKFFLAFLNFLSYLVCESSFNWINSSSLSRKKYDGGNLIPTPRQRLQGQTKSMGIELIDLVEPFDMLSYKPFFKHCILQTITRIFIVYSFMEQNLLF